MMIMYFGIIQNYGIQNNSKIFIIRMLLISALVIIFWWIAIWGIFDIYTENKTKDEKIKIYMIIIGIIFIIICFFPKLIHSLC